MNAPRSITEATVLAMAAHGVVAPHQPQDRPWILDILREAEGRAAEFDHIQRADQFCKVKKLVEAMQ